MQQQLPLKSRISLGMSYMAVISMRMKLWGEKNKGGWHGHQRKVCWSRSLILRKKNWL